MRDISDILNEWPYDASSFVRKIVAADGRELIQVRTAMGIEQYELEGRPDGNEPFLEQVEAQLNKHIEEVGTPEGFEIDGATAAELQQEGLIYYYRYLVCFQIGEYGVVQTDTARNLRMFDLLRAYCKDEELANASEQYRPYVLRMNAAARALMAVGVSRYGRANAIIHAAIETISHLPDVPTATFEYEKRRSLAILRGMHRAIPEDRPPTQEDLLRRQMHEAVVQENYEQAAEIRDRLTKLALEHDQSPSPSPERTSND